MTPAPSAFYHRKMRRRFRLQTSPDEMLGVGVFFGAAMLAQLPSFPSNERLFPILWIIACFTLAAAGRREKARRARLARRQARTRAGRCAACDYDLTGNLSGVCPGVRGGGGRGRGRKRIAERTA